MTYEEAKAEQVRLFKEGKYTVLREDQYFPGSFDLIPTHSRTVAAESMAKDVIAEIRRFPTKLRVFPGGKK